MVFKILIKMDLFWVGLNSTNDSNNHKLGPIVFLNNGVFNPSTIFYQKMIKNSSELYTWNGGMQIPN